MSKHVYHFPERSRGPPRYPGTQGRTHTHIAPIVGTHKLRCLSVPSWLYPTLHSPESDISVGSEQALSGFQSPTATGNRVQKATRTETSVVFLAGEPAICKSAVFLKKSFQHECRL